MLYPLSHTWRPVPSYRRNRRILLDFWTHRNGVGHSVIVLIRSAAGPGLPETKGFW